MKVIKLIKVKKYAVGTVHLNNKGEEFVITQKDTNDKYRWIMFLDEYKHQARVHISCISNCSIRNPYAKSVFGVACMGENVTTKHPLFNNWKNMLKGKFYTKKLEDVYIDPRWYCFEYYVKDIFIKSKAVNL